jgi:CBS domain-containing protein
MTHDVRLACPEQTLAEAAMSDIDSGVVPVADSDRPVGMITDRDIAIRAIAQGKGPETPVSEAMSLDITGRSQS